MLKKELYQHRDEILELCKSEKIKKLMLFGSTARDESTESSDIDFVVEFQERRSLFKLIALKHKLEDMLKNHIDLMTPDSLSPYFRDEVLKEAEVVYEV